VKPDIVFFGESLPPRFLTALPNLAEADLLIVMGTSLTVHPFARLVDMVPNDCPRVLINMDKVGAIGTRSDDVVLLGKCDDTVKAIASELGWLKELEEAWEKTRFTVGQSEEQGNSNDLKTEVDKLAESIATAFTVSDANIEPPNPPQLPKALQPLESPTDAEATKENKTSQEVISLAKDVKNEEEKDKKEADKSALELKET